MYDKHLKFRIAVAQANIANLERLTLWLRGRVGRVLAGCVRGPGFVVGPFAFPAPRTATCIKFQKLSVIEVNVFKSYPFFFFFSFSELTLMCP